MAQFRYFLVLFVPVLTFVIGWVSGQQAVQKSLPKGTLIVNEGNVSADGTLTDLWFGDAAKLSIDPEKIDLEQFWTVWDHINRGYVDMEHVDEEQLIYGAIEGLAESLDDPYTYYMPPDDTEEFNDSLNGDLEGIGAEISKKDGNIVVVSPLKNAPAEQAGLLPGDIIFLIDEESTVGMSLYEAVSQIRGEPGTEVVLTILREGEDDALEIAITREAIKVPSVSYEMKDGNIAYVEVNQFGGNTISEFEKIISELSLGELDGMVLDLRFNGGGYLDGAVDMISFFVEQGKAVSIRMRDESMSETQYVSGVAPMAKIPLVVLINKGSASASEIVAGAIQDHKRGTVVGETSYGKGSVQELQPLSDGSSLRLSVAKWYTPNDRNINEEGIEPDITVEMTSDDYAEDRDPQLDKALELLQDQE